LVINSRSSSHPIKEEMPLGSVYYIPYVTGVSEKFKRIGNQYNIRMIFRTRHTVSSLFMKTRSERDPQQTAEAILVKQADL
jgi:hypothetical protein